MSTIANILISIIIALPLSAGVSGATDDTPQQAAQEFLQGLSSCDKVIYREYAGNDYMDFLAALDEGGETGKRIETILFDDFAFAILDYGQKNNVAVAKVRITNSDFSGLMKGFRKASYKYIMNNFYDESVTDKDALAAKCLDIYADRLEKAGSDRDDITTEIFIPMVSDGNGGWTINVDEQMMRTLLGNLSLSTEE